MLYAPVLGPPKHLYIYEAIQVTVQNDRGRLNALAILKILTVENSGYFWPNVQRLDSVQQFFYVKISVDSQPPPAI